MPSIPPDVARLLKTEDVQRLDPERLPILAGSNGDFLDDTLAILGALEIEDDVFRNVTVTAEGDAAVIGIGGAIATAAPTLYATVDDNLAEFAAVVEISDFIVRKMSGDNPQQALQEAGKLDQIRKAYGKVAFEGTGPVPGTGFFGIDVRTPAGQRAPALTASAALLLTNLEIGLRECGGENVCVVAHPDAATMLHNAAMRITDSAAIEWVNVPGIGWRPRYKGVTIYYNENLTVDFDVLPQGTSSLYFLDRDMGKVLVSRNTPCPIVEEVQDTTADLTRKRVTWNAGLTILSREKGTYVVEAFPHGPLA